MEKKKKRPRLKIKLQKLGIIASLVAILVSSVLCIPTFAIVNSSQGTFNDFTLSAKSTFPLTVGFSYSTRNPDLGVGNTYVYATEIGGYGEEWNTTLYGTDEYTQNYIPMDGVEYELQGELSYNFLERVFDDDASIVWDDGSYQSVIKRGYQVLSMSNSIDGIQRGVVFRASDVVYNPAWLRTIEDGTALTNESMLPCFLSPNVENPSEERLVYTYQYNVTITDQNGRKATYTDTVVYDTLEDNSSRYIPIIPVSVLKNYELQKTIVIDQFYGYLKVQAYRYIEDVIDGTYMLKTNLTDNEISSLPYMTIWPDEPIGSFNTPDGVRNLSFIECTNSSKRVEFQEDASNNGLIFYSNSKGTTTGFAQEYVRYIKYDSGYSYQYFDKTSSVAESYRTFEINQNVYSLYSTDFDKLKTFLNIGATKVNGVDEPYWYETSSPMDNTNFKITYPLYDTSGVVITNSETYKNNMDYYSFPTFSKYLATQNTYIAPPPAYEADYTSWLGTAVSGFLDMELFPNFSIGGVLGIIIAFSFVMLFLKFFAGG